MRAIKRLKLLEVGSKAGLWDSGVGQASRLPEGVALIGFCGGPWTVASYMIEGGSSEERLKARLAAHLRPEWFIDCSIGWSRSRLSIFAQIEAGAEVVQIFDSWAGDLPGDVEDSVVAPIRCDKPELRRRDPCIAGHCVCARCGVEPSW